MASSTVAQWTYNPGDASQRRGREMPRKKTPEQEWREFLDARPSAFETLRRVFRLIPSDPRCALCNLPYAGIGGLLLRLSGGGPWERNPRFCKLCFRSLPRAGGAETELSLLFTDVRGSTPMAQRMSPSELRAVMDRFVDESTRAVMHTNGLIEKFIGDEVAALYIPRYTGRDHARAAIDGAQRLLRATGHDRPEGPWIPLGAGVHTGRAYVGTVGSGESRIDLAALGDTVNTAARLADVADIGEILVSEEAARAAGLDASLERRRLELKGRSEPIDVRVLRVAA